jgi:hypothetical protein
MIMFASAGVMRAILVPSAAPIAPARTIAAPNEVELDIASAPETAEFLAKTASAGVLPLALAPPRAAVARGKLHRDARTAVAARLPGDDLEPGRTDAADEPPVGWSLHAFEGSATAPVEPLPAAPTANLALDQVGRNESTELSAATQRMFAVALDDADYAKGTTRGGPILAAARRAMSGENAPDVGKAMVTVRYLRGGQHHVAVQSTGDASSAWPNFRRDLETALGYTNVRVAPSAAGLEVHFEIEALHQLYDGRDERIVGTVRGGTLNPEAKSDRNPDLPRVTVVGAVYNGRVCSGVAGVALQRSPNGLPAVPFGLGVGLDCGVNVPSRRMVRVAPLGESRL